MEPPQGRSDRLIAGKRVAFFPPSSAKLAAVRPTLRWPTRIGADVAVYHPTIRIGRVAEPVCQIVGGVGANLSVGVPNKGGEAAHSPFFSDLDQGFDRGISVWSKSLF